MMVALNMKLKRAAWWMAIGIATISPMAVHAQTSASSSTAPATPATNTPNATTQASFEGNDWTSPAKAVASYYMAMAKADGMGITQSVTWKDAEDGRRIAASMIWVNSDKKLREMYAALMKAYPKDVYVEAYVKKNMDELEKRSKQQQAEIDRMLNQVRDGDIQVNGNSATVRPKGREKMTLMKTEGQWKIMVESLEPPFGDITAEMRKEMAASAARSEKMQAIRTHAYDRYILDLRLGKYPTGTTAIEARGVVELEIARKAAEIASEK